MPETPNAPTTDDADALGRPAPAGSAAGPWTAHAEARRGGYYRWVEDAEGRFVAHDMTADNARLIANAPALAEALRDAYDSFVQLADCFAGRDGCDGETYANHSAYDILRALKAAGC